MTGKYGQRIMIMDLHLFLKKYNKPKLNPMLLVFDDDPKFRAPYKQNLPRMGVAIEVMECSTKEEMRKKLADKEFMQKVKILVFDLSASKEEAESLKFDILNDIKENYDKYPIPIF